MDVRKLIELLKSKDPDLPVVVQGTEWNLPANGIVDLDYQPRRQDGKPKGDPYPCVFITLDFSA